MTINGGRKIQGTATPDTSINAFFQSSPGTSHDVYEKVDGGGGHVAYYDCTKFGYLKGSVNQTSAWGSAY